MVRFSPPPRFRSTSARLLRLSQACRHPPTPRSSPAAETLPNNTATTVATNYSSVNGDLNAATTLSMSLWSPATPRCCASPPSRIWESPDRRSRKWECHPGEATDGGAAVLRPALSAKNSLTLTATRPPAEGRDHKPLNVVNHRRYTGPPCATPTATASGSSSRLTCALSGVSGSAPTLRPAAQALRPAASVASG